jgi:ATP-dependent RNA helicase DHX57
VSELGRSRRAAAEFCAEFGLSQPRLEQMHLLRQQLRSYLTALNLELSDENARDPRIVTSCLTAGFWPNIIRSKHPNPKFQKTVHGAMELAGEAKQIQHSLKNNVRCFIHPQSLYYDEQRFESGYLVYLKLLKTSQVFVHDVSMIWPMSIVLFGSADFQIDHHQGTILIDGWIEYSVRPTTAYFLAEVRHALDHYLLQRFLAPAAAIADPQAQTFFSMVITLLKEDGLLS